MAIGTLRGFLRAVRAAASAWMAPDGLHLLFSLAKRLTALFNAPVQVRLGTPPATRTMRLLLGRRAMVGPAFWAAAALVAQTPAPPALAAGGPSSLSGKPRPETGVILLEPVVQSGTRSSPSPSPSSIPS